MFDRTDRGPIVRILAAAIAVRVLSALLGFFAVITFPPDRPQTVTMWSEPSPFWDQFTRWDSGWYFQIAKYGYRFVEGGPPVGLGKPGKIAYFPVYPLATRAASRAFGRSSASIYLGGLLVSWTAFAAALVLLYGLARLDVSPPAAERAALLTAVFPFGYFFGMVYTESLFLLLTVGTFYLFRTRRWLAGGAAGALATATRVNGLMMMPALAWIAWKEAAPAMRDRGRAIAGLALAVCGVGAYSAYVYTLTGNPFEWAASIGRWDYHPGGAPWLAPVRLIATLLTHPYRYFTTDAMALYDTLYGLCGVAFVVAIPFVWRRLGAAYGLFMLANLWLPLSSGALEGVGRYCSVLFPAFIWLGSIESRWRHAALIVLFSMLYALGLSLFVTGRPLY